MLKSFTRHKVMKQNVLVISELLSVSQPEERFIKFKGGILFNQK